MRRTAMWLIIASAVLSLAIAYLFIQTTWSARAKVVAARKALRSLSDCVEVYKLKYGDYPPSLEDLTQKQPGGAEPLVDEKALTDPWGRPYKYEAGNQMKGMMRAKIWSAGPDPNDPKNSIGN